MKRSLLITALLASLATGASGASLRGNQVHVASDIVTLADIFDGLTGPGDGEVAHAPAPGKTILLDSATLFGIAAANHLDWQPRGLSDKVIVMRDGDAVTGMPTLAGNALQAVIAPLTPALAAKGAGEKLAILLDSGEQQRLLVGLPATASLAVETLDFDAATRRFSTTLTDIASGERHTVTGRAIAMVHVPVPSHRIAQGDTILAQDIDGIDQRADQLRSDTTLNAASLVGKIAKRTLEANQPVQDRFLGVPILIKRGDRITMIVRNAGIVLTAEGHAENDAGLGEVVRLTNSATNKELSGIATGASSAEVRTDAAIVAAAAATPPITR